MFERGKLITNFSLTLLSVANKFDIVVWKSNEYIHLVKLNVINLTCSESIKHLFAVESKICPLLSKFLLNSFASAHLLLI